MARYTPAHLALAKIRSLTRGNTETGSPERSAVYRIELEERRERGERKGLTAQQSYGHSALDDVLPTITLYVEHPPRLVVLEDVSRSDARRAGRYMGAVGALLAVEDTDAWNERAQAFQRRFKRWGPIAGHTLVTDPATLLALEEARRAGGQEVKFDSGRAEPGPRRRQSSLTTRAALKQTRRRSR